MNRSPHTIKVYTEGVRGYLRWCETTGADPELSKLSAQAHLADLLAGGLQSATVRSRYGALRQFSKWLAEEGEVDTDPLLGLKSPSVDVKVVNSLTDDELRLMLKACSSGKRLRGRRDEAIIRLMTETGLRANELLEMRITDVDLTRGLATVARGKGGKGRVVPFGAQTATAIDRYLRLRKSDNGFLWLGGFGDKLAYHGLYDSLKERAQVAGIEKFHIHRLRHTAATRWLAAGGSEGGLMAMAGWSNRAMLDRYTAASASERAADEARTLHLGL
ncbi:MAG: hypothetical protein QOC63_3924 [Mycobacterium sp.]|nr:hypothetical protein [Mycobacterium sp.]